MKLHFLKPTKDDPDTYPLVPIDDNLCEMLTFAVRYALGRRTYAASDTAAYVKFYVHYLNDNTLRVMYEDIRSAKERDFLGDPKIDAPYWIALMQAIADEINKRKAENNHE